MVLRMNPNGNTPASHVWCWPDAPYVGWGTTAADGIMPWTRVWLARERVQGELGVWLRSLPQAPALDWGTAPASAMPASAAAALAQLIRRLLAADGVRLLRDRDYHGSAPPRPAGGCRSIRELAKTLGISRRQASRLAGFTDYDGRSGSPDRADFNDFGGFSDLDGCRAGITGPGG